MPWCSAFPQQAQPSALLNHRRRVAGGSVRSPLYRLSRARRSAFRAPRRLRLTARIITVRLRLDTRAAPGSRTAGASRASALGLPAASADDPLDVLGRSLCATQQSVFRLDSATRVTARTLA